MSRASQNYLNTAEANAPKQKSTGEGNGVRGLKNQIIIPLEHIVMKVRQAHKIIINYGVKALDRIGT